MSGTALRSSALFLGAAFFSSAVDVHAEDVTTDRTESSAADANGWGFGNSQAFAEAQQALANDPTLNEYHERRKKTPRTMAGHLQLARWCERRGLDAQSRAHFHGVLSLDPDNQEAWRGLGFVKFGEEWIHEEDLQRLQEQSEARREALKHWKPIAVKIRTGLRSEVPRRHEAALGQLRAIDTPEAILALEWAFASESETLSQQVLDRIAQIHGQQATASLVRHAVFSPFGNVRVAAANYLKKRPADEYAPLLVGLLSTPMESRVEVSATPDGRRSYRHMIYREGPQARHLTIAELDIDSRRSSAVGIRNTIDGGFFAGIGQMRASDIAQRRLGAQQESVAKANEAIAELNDRTMWVMRRITDKDMDGDPIKWWNYWAHYMQYSSVSKPLLTAFQRTSSLYAPPS